MRASLYRIIFAIGLVCFLCGNIEAASESDSSFPTPTNSKDPRLVPTPPAEALAKIKAPPGFKVSVFAAEPDVQNPIAMTFDERGRLWVAENYTYSEKGKWSTNFHDRILVFEDTKHTGHFDKRTVFWDGAERLTSVEVGFGGVWLLCSPNLLFIPVRDGELKPSGPPQLMLDGWNDTDMIHNIVNGLRWGPDGWLYGRQGISSTSFVGKPGAPANERTKISCCIWRYHPTRHVFEVVCWGTTNPWGMDWNNVGQGFFVNTVIGHFWHAIPGAHFKRMWGDDFDPHVYDLIDQHADHYHWDHRLKWTQSRGPGNTSSDYGGGHAHDGLLIYQGDNWPEQYRNSVYMINLHGLRINNDYLTRTGSGYVAHHTNDFLFFNDDWFRGVDLINSPDGGVYVADYCDTGECHDDDGVHRTSGRIYKITYGTPNAPIVTNLDALKDEQLVQLQLAKNDWYARKARLLLQERAASGKDMSAAQASLHKMFDEQTEIPLKLRAMWALATSGGVPPKWLIGQLDAKDENVRVWAIKLLTDDKHVSPQALKKFVHMAGHDESGLVRLTLASTLQRLPAAERGDLARALIAHSEDVGDHNLPLMFWYGIEPMFAAVPEKFLELEWQTKIPVLQKFIARRIAEEIEHQPALVSALLKSAAKKGSTEQQLAILDGVSLALQGWRKARKPDSWDAAANVFLASSDKNVQSRATELGAIFGDDRAIKELRRVALDESASPDQRRTALQTLVENRPPDLLSVIMSLLGDKAMARTAVQGLATFTDPSLAQQLVANYPHFQPDIRPDVIATLTSRAPFATKLLQAIGDKKIPRRDISAFDARQIHQLGDAKLDALLVKQWGEFQTTSEDKLRQMAAWKAKLTPDVLKTANVQHGHQLFQKTCEVCHRLYGEGASIGPDLTGSGRTNMDYLLERLTNPSGVVSANYKMSVVEMKDDRVLSGIIAEQKERTVTIQTASAKVVLPRDEIQSITASKLSMMPEGLIDNMSESDVRDLVAYVTTPSQP
ncbi:MAG TPA: PVC-type heme-binding CxxCH protein [Verrucomicrobiae bacterium]|nr:PVC-type heme-binding CxxCH protein [Verrucomicrobiae bacterium]